MTYAEFQLRYTGYQPFGSFNYILVGIGGGRREYREADRPYRARLAKRYWRRYASQIASACPIAR